MASTSSSLSPAFTAAPTSTKGFDSGVGPQIGRADHRRFDRSRALRRPQASSAAACAAAAGAARLRRSGRRRQDRRRGGRSLARDAGRAARRGRTRPRSDRSLRRFGELVDRGDIDKASRRLVGSRAERLLHCVWPWSGMRRTATVACPYIPPAQAKKGRGFNAVARSLPQPTP